MIMNVAWYEWFGPFVIGLAGSLHCVGMCGPLVVACSLKMKEARSDVRDSLPREPGPPEIPGGGPPWNTVQGTSTFEAADRKAPGGTRQGPSTRFSWTGEARHHLAFHAGRLITYGTLGALGAMLLRAVDLYLVLVRIRPGVTLAGGAILVFMGLVLLRVCPVPRLFGKVASAPLALLGDRLRGLLQSRGIAAAIGLGIAAGLLPCCLSWAMVLSAAASLDPARGFLAMVAFGLGTVPALFAVGFSSSFLSHRFRLLGERAAAVSIIVMGLMLFYRGVEILA
jgi:uncharacterized protein